MDSAVDLRPLGLYLMMYGSPLFAAAVCYGVFRRRIGKLGIDENGAFPSFIRYLAPFAGIALGALALLAFCLDVLDQLKGDGPEIPRWVVWLVIYGPAVAAAGALTGCAAWLRTSLGPKKDGPL